MEVPVIRIKIYKLSIKISLVKVDISSPLELPDPPFESEETREGDRISYEEQIVSSIISSAKMCEVCKTCFLYMTVTRSV